jgi:hypothetical protein
MTLTLCILGSIICLALLIIAVCKILQVRKERRELRPVAVYIGPDDVPFIIEEGDLQPIHKFWR